MLLVFLDGVGLGGDDAARNAFVAAGLPVLTRLLEGRRAIAGATPFHGKDASLVGLDATLGVDGLPQSGTGQTTLFTGVDAVRMHGRHFGPWVPVGLRPLLLERSVLARAAAAGRRVTFANAYPEELVEAGRAALAAGGRRMPPYLRAGPPLAALGAGVLNRHTLELERDEAVASEITNDGWREHLGRSGVPVRTAAQTGGTLARIASAHDFTLFAHYATDTAGHRGALAGAIAALERVDAFLGGLTAAAPPDLRIVITSDHGNIEDCTVGHTRNPAVCLVLGAGHEAFAAGLHSLLDVTPAILRELGAA